MKHMQNLEKFAQELSATVNRRLPSYDKPYGQVSILAFHWENDGIGVAPLEVGWLDVFWKIYCWITQAAEIGMELIDYF